MVKIQSLLRLTAFLEVFPVDPAESSSAVPDAVFTMGTCTCFATGIGTTLSTYLEAARPIPSKNRTTVC